MKKVTQNGTVASHERYLYRGYLQIAAQDMLDNRNVLRTLLWDPLEPVATRPPGPRAGRFPVLLRHGLQQECHRGLRRTGNDRGGLRLLPLWGRDRYGQPRTTRPVVRRDARWGIGTGLL